MGKVYTSQKFIGSASAILLLHLLAVQPVFSQNPGGVSINSLGLPPDSTAMLDVNSQVKGLLLPRMTTAQRNAIGNPATSLMIYNTTTNCFEAYGFGIWQPISCLCSGPPSAPASITGNTVPCISSSSTYTIAPVNSATSYTWAAPSGSIISSGQGTDSINIFTGSNAGNISVTANNNCGSSAPVSLAINIALTPATPGNISGNSNPCPGSVNSYSIAAVNGASTYTWTVPAGSIVQNGQGTSSVTVLIDSTAGNISVSANNSCGSSATDSLPVTLNTGPSAPGNISGPTAVTINQAAVNYSINAVNNANTYTWTVPPGASIISGQGTTSITVNFGADSGNVCVAADNSCGTSGSSCLAVSNCLGTGSMTFNYTGSAQTFTVPNCVSSITITAYGASGGGNANNTYGGSGAEMKGTFVVTPAQLLNVIVGQEGYYGPYGSGGGGGSGLTYNGSVWIDAGGGGGLYYSIDNNVNATTNSNGNNGDNGSDGTAGGGNAGGNGGNGNYSGESTAYGGNGIDAGINGSTGTDGYTTSATTTSDGSFGLGGGGGGVGAGECSCGGGGGGYSGGGAGDVNASGGGGGSYNSGTNQTNISAVNSGNGQIVISW